MEEAFHGRELTKMTSKLNVFISSVRKELEDERPGRPEPFEYRRFPVGELHAVLSETEPASPQESLEGCLQALDECQVYLLIVEPNTACLWTDCLYPTQNIAARRKGIFPFWPSSGETAA
jgi:hypothetical protein